MLRFVFAGLVIVGGMVALLLASSGGIPGVWPHSDRRAVAPGVHARLAVVPHPDLPHPSGNSDGRVAAPRTQPDHASRDLKKLRDQAKQEQQQLAKLQQEHSADQARLAQLKDAEATEQKAAATARQQAEAARDEAARARHEAARQQAAAQQAAQQLARERAIAGQARKAAAAAQAITDHAHRREMAEQAQLAAAGRAQGGSNSTNTPPARLHRGQTQRHGGPPAPPQTAKLVPTWTSPDAGTRRRLVLARNAIANGQLEQARQLLEQAQLRLAFQPAPPGQASASGESGAASDVGDALSMLGTGQRNVALRYVEHALEGTGTASQQGCPLERRRPMDKAIRHVFRRAILTL